MRCTEDAGHTDLAALLWTPSSAKGSDSHGMLHTYARDSNEATYRWVGKTSEGQWL